MRKFCDEAPFRHCCCMCCLQQCHRSLYVYMLVFPLRILTSREITDIWTTLLAGGTQSTAAVRQPLNNSPVESASSADQRCNRTPRPATETVNVSAGSSIGFRLDNNLYHSGPAAIYLGKAPGNAADWDGSGANWFKVLPLPSLPE